MHYYTICNTLPCDLLALAYPENDIYNAERGDEIYHNCISEASIVIKYGKNVSDILRAEMIMVLLSAAYACG